MEKKETRFAVVLREGNQLSEEGVRQILVDKQTGVNFLVWKAGYAGGIMSAAMDGIRVAEHVAEHMITAASGQTDD